MSLLPCVIAVHQWRWKHTNLEMDLIRSPMKTQPRTSFEQSTKTTQLKWKWGMHPVCPGRNKCQNRICRCICCIYYGGLLVCCCVDAAPFKTLEMLFRRILFWVHLQMSFRTEVSAWIACYVWEKKNPINGWLIICVVIIVNELQQHSK